jgi:hypothetical protein
VVLVMGCVRIAGSAQPHHLTALPPRSEVSCARA